MEKTITFTITESQAKSFEKLLDENLEIFKRWKEESPERDAAFDRGHEEIMDKLAQVEKNISETSKRLAKWKIPQESNNVGKDN